MGTALAWRYRQESKSEFLSGNRTRTGQENTLKARLEPTRSKLAVNKHSSFRPNLPTLPPPSYSQYEYWLIQHTAFPIALNFIASG